MELWIRSQSKISLVKVNDLSIERKQDNVWFITCNDKYRLGTYRNKERALEVLDEIQKLLMPTYKFIANKDLEGNDIKVYGVEYINSYVYEMPKE